MRNPKLINGGIAIMVGVLLVALVFGQGVDQVGIRQPESPPSPPVASVFVGNLSAGGERFSVVTVVFKRGVPDSVVQQVYNEMRQLYSGERLVAAAGGRQVRVMEVRVSRLVRDAQGRYMFRVADSPDAVKKALSRYSDYVEAVLAKPVPKPFDMLPEGVSSRGIIAPSNAIIRDLIGVSQVERVYGVDGSGVNIAVVDTGVDYGHPDLTTALRYWSGTYKGDSIREPLVFDADQSQVLLLQPVSAVNSTHIYVGGRYYETLVPWSVYIYPPCNYYKLPSIWFVQGAEFRFGVTYMQSTYSPIVVVGVLLVKPPGWNYFARAIVDANGNCRFDDEILPPIDPYARGSILRYEDNRIIAPDYNRNGFPDVSLGVAGGFFYDFYWRFSYPAEIHPGWDRQGRWLSIFYDFDSHGTACTSAAAGRGVVGYNVTGLGVVRLRGMAPGAGVLGVKALWMGNVEVGMLWAAGFDVDPATGQFYYTGSRRADVISNSWGISYFAYDAGAFGADFESAFVAGLSLPGFLDPRYPGVLIIQAGGNGGPGYGTITSPGAAPGVVTVGASTSTHFAYVYTRMNMTVYASGGGWTSDEVISWSLRGPTPLGYIKPDVVNVGAGGFTAAPVALNYTLFGGTSYATPLTAGVAALVLQVLGRTADPALVKTVLQSSAVLLRYDGASQGFGRVDAFRAVSLARLLAGRTAARYELIVQSNSLWGAYASKYGSLWLWQWCDNIRAYMLWWAGTDLQPQSCSLPTGVSSRVDGVLFFGDVPQGGSKSIAFTVRNPTNKTVSVSASPRQFTVTRTLTLTRSLSLAPGYPYNRTYWVFTSSNLTTTYRFMDVVATIPYSRFDADNDYVMDVRVRVWIHIWRADANGNGRPDPDEMMLVNYGYNWANWNLATMATPTIKLGSYRGIVVSVDLVRGPDAPSYVPPVPVTVAVTYVDVVSDPWVSVSPSSATIPPGGSATFTLTVRPHVNAVPTTYIGEVVVTNNITGFNMQVPYSFNVYATVGTSFVNLTAGVNGRWPDARSIRGATDWAWRFESGDWRLFHIAPGASNGLAFEVQAGWRLPDTSLIGFAVGPDGQFAGAYFGQGASWFRYLGGGVFMWVNTGAGSMDNARRVVWFPSVDYRDWLYPHAKPEGGVFTVVVRTVLFDGSAGASEPISVQARLLTAAQKLPAQVIGGGTNYVRFSLPYIVNRLNAEVVRPWTPWLDFDQRYTPGSYYVSPSWVSGPYPAGTPFTFSVYVSNYGAPGQKFDVSVLFRADLPSLPVVFRSGNSYTRYTTWYLFEDWTRVVR
jgi:subtilisin family serine protease